ncbi:glycosyltransferase [Candidatus Synechococcus calcipolaris G9]|uniref:Glycosyltransferase n=1 Tax=Candidatus Synechococcus calcipolaris G9 TaxID=1497997 RepID=A0ABT6EYP6_9SYNE|nr:glycosyltransferase [Candidatus Synechococcus calcipolaris]MDG2990411.1 glycosyltransferase [Candidatus Synechococcus calcipolaris G9]
MKIGILFINFGPYHIARIRRFHDHARQKNFQVVGIELARSTQEYLWKNDILDLGFPIIPLIQNQPIETVSWVKQSQLLYQYLQHLQPDVLAIAGYSPPAMLAALAWCRWHRRPAILMTESKEDDAPRSPWTERLKGWLIRQYQAGLVGGQPQLCYLEKLGMAPGAIFTGYDVVDNGVFHPEQIRKEPRPIPQSYFLAINRFIPKKNLIVLIEAYADYCQATNGQAGDLPWHFVLCGDGELRPVIEALIGQLGLGDLIHLPGFLQQDQLLPYFAHASCFIHASTQEQWGLVVNEAMAAGLPVLVSNRCGCFEDLILEGVTGFGFDPDNKQQLTNLMLKMSHGQVDLEQIGQSALMHIQKFSPDTFAQGLLQAVDYVLLRQSGQ